MGALRAITGKFDTLADKVCPLSLRFTGSAQHIRHICGACSDSVSACAGTSSVEHFGFAAAVPEQ